MDYFSILNLNKEPFSNSPDPEFFFHSRQHLDCLQKLELSLLLRRGLNVIIGEVGTGKTMLVRSLLAHNDVLLSLPAPEVYNKKSLKGILLSSYRQQKPVVSYSPSHVRSGALASIYTSPDDIGRQIARLANQILQARPPAQRQFHASDFNIMVNQQVARALGIVLPDTDDIARQLNQAAQP